MLLLRKLSTLTCFERQATAEALLVVPAIRLALTVLPFRWVRQWVDGVRLGKSPHDGAQEIIDAAVWSVVAVSLRVPRATCLTQALALRVLLTRRGIESDLHVGVAGGVDVGITAHAWLESDGVVLIGGDKDSLKAFARLEPGGAPQEPEASG